MERGGAHLDFGDERLHLRTFWLASLFASFTHLLHLVLSINSTFDRRKIHN